MPDSTEPSRPAGRHEAADDAAQDPVVAAALARRPEGGPAHAADEPRRGPVSWQGPERDPESLLRWPGDLPR